MGLAKRRGKSLAAQPELRTKYGERGGKAPAILIFDDNRLFAETWADLLKQNKFEVETESNPRDVGRRVREQWFDVILLDLVVENDVYDGFHVLMDIMTYSSLSRVIVVSGPGTTEQVVRCIKHGASSFISKTSLTRPEDVQLLIDHITVVLEAPEIRHEPETLRQTLIESLWSNIRNGTPAELGRRLEQLLKLLFESLPAFYKVTLDYHAKSEEFDLVITHDNRHTIWQQFGGLYIAECKNWSDERRPPGREDLDAFAQKIVRRGTLGRLGFFISYNGFPEGFMETARSYNNTGKITVVLIDANDLATLVSKKDGIAREEHFRKLVIQATMMS